MKIWSLVVIPAIALSQASCFLPIPLRQDQKDAITADTNCLDHYGISPIWMSQCSSIKNGLIAARDSEAKARQEKSIKDKTDKDRVRNNIQAWDSYKDVAAYPSPGTYQCKLETIKAMGGGSILFGASSAKACESWIVSSRELGLNKPPILKDYPELVPLFLEQDRSRAFEMCQGEGLKRGYALKDISLSSESYENNALQPGDGRYHCDAPTPQGTITFHSFTHVDGSMSEGEIVANKAHNFHDFKTAVENAKSLPYVAEIDCGGYPLALCFGLGDQTILGQLEIRDGGSSKMYSGYALLGREFNSPKFKTLLHEKFILNIRNGSSYNQINLKIFNALTGTILYEKSAGPFGSIHVKN